MCPDSSREAGCGWKLANQQRTCSSLLLSTTNKLLASNMDSEHIRVTDILDFLLRNAITKASYSVLKVIFRDYKGAIFQTTHNVMGRKVDVLVSIGGVEVSFGEWKAANAKESMVHKQGAKSRGTNACIYENLIDLPYDDGTGLDMKAKWKTHGRLLFNNTAPSRLEPVNRAVKAGGSSTTNHACKRSPAHQFTPSNKPCRV
ncbi:predicted protein [Lichtheimia corymbifera JMRC:FSU:9682]|uniref:Uncharacterized protein n=1 Tax=Lichtheimia corymbifera JMRC:FSU:9682 TaxID=1263082 RepID=A0A068RLT7_9FUNG|nr:predicted protein [Lichtheimia corymbifera JMRC:FSU:9682]